MWPNECVLMSRRLETVFLLTRSHLGFGTQYFAHTLLVPSLIDLRGRQIATTKQVRPINSRSTTTIFCSTRLSIGILCLASLFRYCSSSSSSNQRIFLICFLFCLHSPCRVLPVSCTHGLQHRQHRQLRRRRRLRFVCPSNSANRHRR